MNDHNNFQSTQAVTLKEAKMARLMFLKQEKEVLLRIILELFQQAVEFHVEPWPKGIYYALYVKEEQATLLEEMKNSLVDASLGQIISGMKDSLVEASLGQILSDPSLSSFQNLSGKIIQRVRRMSPAELEANYWYPDSEALVIELTDGTLLYPSQDEEGNGPGVLFAQTAEGQVFTLIDREANND